MEMPSPDAENIVYDHRLSSVVPASITGEDKVVNLTNADLAMKLHYLRGVYLFSSEAVEGITVHDLKNPMFQLLESYYPAAGRIRKSAAEDGAGGRPLVKCNDSGVRIIEAKCRKSVDEWLDLYMRDPTVSKHHEELLHNDQVLGPDLGFSPLVFIQFTWFKCGGVSIGLNWAHILGDAFSVSDFCLKFGQVMAGQFPPKYYFGIPNNNKNYSPTTRDQKFPLSLGKTCHVGDLWKITNTRKMVTHSYLITDRQLNELIFKVSGFKGSAKTKPFEVICAIIWKSLANIRGRLRSDSYSELNTVTVLKKDFYDTENELLRNGQVISVVKSGLRIVDADVIELANLIAEKAFDERKTIDKFMEEENGRDLSDFFVYGANLTFVNLEEVKMYDFEIKGQKPIFANYTIGGVGDEGAILVLPGPENLKGNHQGGRIVNVILPEHLIEELKNELRKEWGAFEN